MTDSKNKSVGMLDRYLSIASNLAVLFGILFLGYELQLNNQLLQLEARSAASQSMQGVISSYTESAGLYEIREKYNTGEKLTGIESAKLFQYFFLVFRAWQDSYYYYASGLLGGGPETQLKDKLRSLEETAVNDHWESIKEELSSEFVNFVEEARNQQ